MPNRAIRIDEEALARWKEAAGVELDDNAAANAAVRMAADAQGREVAAEALGMQRLAAWVADGHADPAALVAGDVEVTVADNLEIRARIGDARFILAQNPVSARRRVVTAANKARELGAKLRKQCDDYRTRAERAERALAARPAARARPSAPAR